MSFDKEPGHKKEKDYPSEEEISEIPQSYSFGEQNRSYEKYPDPISPPDPSLPPPPEPKEKKMRMIYPCAAIGCNAGIGIISFILILIAIMALIGAVIYAGIVGFVNVGQSCSSSCNSCCSDACSNCCSSMCNDCSSECCGGCNGCCSGSEGTTEALQLENTKKISRYFNLLKWFFLFYL
ncbi:MAG: hypothetical protein GF308_10825 [Candidatus Heimdallarchaeota archaeon]|nr:hypothetical protein [Candidatus Heimdallarchaeota archaeon]